MKVEINQIQTQRLILSPQIRQFLRLLQMPLVELSAAIEQELSTNPALEEEAENTHEDSPVTDGNGLNKEEEKPLVRTEDSRLKERLENLLRIEENYGDSSYYSNNVDPESSDDSERKHAYRQSLVTKPVTLSDHLHWQKMHLKLSEDEDRIAQFIIGNINEDGYLKITVDEIVQETKRPREEVEKILRQIQQFDPPGVGASSLAECLVLQLKRMDRDTRLATRIISECISLLERRKYLLIARQLGVNEQSVNAAVALIASLEPKPGRQFYRDEAVAVVPDIRIAYDEVTGKFRADLIDDEFPRLRISAQYRRMLRDRNLDKKAKEYLRERINSGLWFMNAMEQRKSTLKKIADAIVEFQPEFLEHGPSHLRPFRMKDVAARIGIHESTVSRAIQRKYMETPHSTVSLKSFFSSSIATDDGGSESQTSIMEKIKRLIEKEDLQKPLSDQQLMAHLRQEGIRIARRTVAKYREMLRILPSHFRRRDSAAA